MKKENILLLAASGFIVANLFAKTIEKHARLSPRKVLFDIKKKLNKDKGFYDGWMKNPKSAMLSCNDGFRPVSFLVEALDEDAD